MTTEAENLRGLIKGAGLSRAQVAGLLYVSIHTVDAWGRPDTNKNANPTPRWAVELLAYKTRQPIPPLAAPGPANGAGEASEPAPAQRRPRGRPGPATRDAART